MPNNTMVDMEGSCQDNSSELTLNWERNGTEFTSIMEFEIMGGQWFLSMAQLDFNLDSSNFENPFGKFFVCDSRTYRPM